MVTVYLAYALSALAVLLPAQPLIHIFQLESYKRAQLFMRLSEDPSVNRSRMRRWRVAIALQLAVLLAMIFILQPLFGDSYAFTFVTAIPLMTVVFLAVMLADFLAWKKRPSKKPLKMTARVIRLDIALAAVSVLLHAAVYVLCMALVLLAAMLVPVLPGGEQDKGAPAYMLFSFAAVAAPYLCLLISQFYMVRRLPRLLALAAMLASPVETGVKNWYFNDARKKLLGYTGMIRVGITGSYGKTSAKVILATILSEKYMTYATPHSYNTPMGVTRAIREQLDGRYKVFIAEMGARQSGDIAEMCRLVQPQYGLLTSVGPQHLETFHTIEAVAKTKYELIEALPEIGRAFFPCDGGICLELYRKTKKPKALFGTDSCEEPLYMAATDIENGPDGGAFTLTGPDGASVRCTTRLLGRHNVQNIVGAAAVAHALGMTLKEIARGISKIKPVEHRLELVPTGNGITVIDDAFNSNPAGTRAALEVLKSFPGRKIIVTPGLVELGDAEAAENEAFGRAMAGAVDIAILVARNAPAMKKGLIEAGFPEENLIVTGKLAEATAALGALTKAGDVVLFENDLPDHYET